MNICEKKYGDPHYTNRAQAIKTTLKLYTSPKGKEITDHIYQVKKKNHTLNTSKLEKDVKEWLEQNHINFKYQYKSKEYPFNCDFYFPDKQLYLEIQGNWTHGPHPYDKDNEDDMKIINEWKSKNNKYYDNAIYDWTVRDVNKRTYAKEHNLNFCELFQPTLTDVINFVKENVIGKKL